MSMGDKDPEQGYENTGARPKRSVLKNWPLPVDDVIEDTFPSSILRRFPPKLCVNSFHQQSLDEALEMRNLTLDEEREFAQVLTHYFTQTLILPTQSYEIDNKITPRDIFINSL